MFSVFICLECMWGWFKITVYLGCKFQTCSSWQSSEFKIFIDNKLKFYVLHFSVWGDLWPYSNAYVRPGTRAIIQELWFNFIGFTVEIVWFQIQSFIEEHKTWRLTYWGQVRSLILHLNCDGHVFSGRLHYVHQMSDEKEIATKINKRNVPNCGNSIHPSYFRFTLIFDCLKVWPWQTLHDRQPMVWTVKFCVNKTWKMLHNSRNILEFHRHQAVATETLMHHRAVQVLVKCRGQCTFLTNRSRVQSEQHYELTQVNWAL